MKLKNKGMSSFANQWGKSTSQSEFLTKEMQQLEMFIFSKSALDIKAKLKVLV